MTQTTSVDPRVRDYLAAVRRRLRGLEADETLAVLESHIHEAVEARRAAGEQGDLVGAVLADMASPEEYGYLEQPRDSARLSVLGLMAVCLVPLALPVVWHALLLTPLGEGSELPAFFESPVYRFLLLPIGVIAPLVAMLLGSTALHEIAASNGRVEGATLARIGLLGPQLIVANVILLVAYFNTAPSVAWPMLLGGLVVLIGLNACAFRIVLRSRPTG